MNECIEIRQAKQYFEQLQHTAEGVSHETVDLIAHAILHAAESGGTIFVLGNGGSAALASHLACDLGKGTAFCNGNRLRVLALTDNVPILTAWANDMSYEDVFSEQLKNFVEPGDLVLAISGSGNSKNVLNALRVARVAGAKTTGLAGFQGGEMKSLCDICLVIPSRDMQIIEDLHVAAAHSIFRVVYTRMSRHLLTAAQAD